VTKNNRGKSILCAACAAAIFGGVVSAQAAPRDILFILDGSGSMWGQIDGVAKIQTAKDTMIGLIDDVPEDARLGLMTYGTNSKACDDVSMLNVIGSDRAAIKSSIEAIKPLGKTPIDISLLLAMTTLITTEPHDTPKSLVLVSDGIETCDGDPCARASMAGLANIEMKVHVVGFDADADARSQLECIAKNGGGSYFDASDPDGFKKAMDAVVEVAQATAEPKIEEPPKETVYSEIFRDDFDGDELAEHWEIVNANPDNFIVDDGYLVVISDVVDDLGNPDAVQGTNLFKLDFEMPRGDWRMTAKFDTDFQTLVETVRIGVMDKPDKHIEANYRIEPFYTSILKTSKRSGDDVTFFEQHLAAESDPQLFRQLIGGDDSIELQLTKTGRKYAARYRPLAGEDNDWVEADAVSQLRLKGFPFLYFTQGYDTGGETEFLVDWLKIEVPAE